MVFQHFYREHQLTCVSFTGQPASHQEAKELLAGFAGAFADREVEPRMENAYDRRKVQDDAVQQCQDQGMIKSRPPRKWT